VHGLIWQLVNGQLGQNALKMAKTNKAYLYLFNKWDFNALHLRIYLACI